MLSRTMKTVLSNVTVCMVYIFSD